MSDLLILNTSKSAGESTQNQAVTLKSTSVDWPLVLRLVAFDNDSLSVTVTIKDSSSKTAFTQVYTEAGEYGILVDDKKLTSTMYCQASFANGYGSAYIVLLSDDNYINTPSGPSQFTYTVEYQHTSNIADFRAIATHNDRIYIYGQCNSVQQYTGEDDPSGVFTLSDRDKVDTITSMSGWLWAVGWDSSSGPDFPKLYAWKEGDSGSTPSDIGTISSSGCHCYMVQYYNERLHMGAVVEAGDDYSTNPRPVVRLEGDGDLPAGNIEQITRAYSEHVGSYWVAPVVHSGCLYWVQANTGDIHVWDGEDEPVYRIRLDDTLTSAAISATNGHLYLARRVPAEGIQRIFRLNSDESLGQKINLGNTTFTGLGIEQQTCIFQEVTEGFIFGDSLGWIWAIRDDETIKPLNRIKEKSIAGFGKVGTQHYVVTDDARFYTLDS